MSLTKMSLTNCESLLRALCVPRADAFWLPAANRAKTSHGSNTARHASLRLAFCRRRQEMMARTFGISPAQRR